MIVCTLEMKLCQFQNGSSQESDFNTRPCFNGRCISGGSDIHPTQTSVSNKTALVLRKFDLVHLDNKTYSENLIFTVNLTWLFCQHEAQSYGKRAKRKTYEMKKGCQLQLAKRDLDVHED